MGYSTLLDIVGSFMIGGFLLLILWSVNDAAVESTYVNAGELVIQRNLVEVVQLLEYDFRKIGFCDDWTKIPDPSKAIIVAQPDSISFLTDVNSDGQVDTLHYFLGPLTELSHTENPRDRMLYRVTNSKIPRGSNMGITEFELVYFDVLGDTIFQPINITGEINSMQINIKIEDVAAYDTLYSSAFWRQIRLAARNLKNR